MFDRQHLLFFLHFLQIIRLIFYIFSDYHLVFIVINCSTPCGCWSSRFQQLNSICQPSDSKLRMITFVVMVIVIIIIMIRMICLRMFFKMVMVIIIISIRIMCLRRQRSFPPIGPRSRRQASPKHWSECHTQSVFFSSEYAFILEEKESVWVCFSWSNEIAPVSLTQTHVEQKCLFVKS